MVSTSSKMKQTIKILYSWSSSGETEHISHDEQGCLYQNFEIQGAWVRGSVIRAL